MTAPASYSNGFAPRDGRPLYPELWRGCVGAWNPGLGVTGLSLRDWSGFKNHGTLTNMDAAGDWVTSQGRYALDFDGTDDYVAITDARQWHQSDFSFLCWANFRGIGGLNYGTVFSRDNGGTNWAFFSRDFQSFSGKFSANFYDGANNPGVRSAQVLSLSVWYHLGVTVSGNTCTVFINGIADGSGSISTWTRPSISNQRIGSWNINGGRSIDGWIDDSRLYSRALSPNEIRLLSSRRGIAYEMAPRRRSSSAVQFNRRRRLLLGAQS